VKLRSAALGLQMCPESCFKDLLVCQLLVKGIPTESIIELVIDPESQGADALSSKSCRRCR
jgi:hypothetical protein